MGAEDGEKMAREYSAIFMETSSKDGQNILDSLVLLAREMCSNEDVEVQTSTLLIRLLRTENIHAIFFAILGIFMFSHNNDNDNDTLSWKVTTISNQHVLSILWITVVVLFSISGMISQEANANANSSNTQKIQKYQIWQNDVKLNIGGYFQNLKEVSFSPSFSS